LSKKKIKKVFLGDIDDIIVDFIGEFNVYLRKKGHPDATAQRIDKDYMPKTWGYEEFYTTVGYDMERFINENSGNLPVFDGAVEFTQKLRGMGLEIVLMTANPAHKLYERIKSLKSQGIEFDHIYSTAALDHNAGMIKIPKHELTLDLFPDREVYFVDDRLNHVVDFVRSVPNSTGFSLARTYNIGVDCKDTDGKLHIAGCPAQSGKLQITELYDKVLKVLGEKLC
jgi:FMN phosphatase YigB (HAD superfamily)